MPETHDDVRNGLSPAGRRIVEARGLAPDNPLLVQEVIDDFDAIAHLYLRFLGHGKYSPDQLTGLHIVQGRNAFIGDLFKVTAKTGQGKPPSSRVFSALSHDFLSEGLNRPSSQLKKA